MSATICAKDKYCFSNKEIAAFLIAYRDRTAALRKTRPWLHENLPTVLGIPSWKWTAKWPRIVRLIIGKRVVRSFRNITYFQIGKRAITMVILDIIRDSGKTEEAQKEALEKIMEAIAFFEPIPKLQPGNPAGKIDELHKEWAEKLAFQEVKRIKDHLGIPYND